jgi:hypothetical protein
MTISRIVLINNYIISRIDMMGAGTSASSLIKKKIIILIEIWDIFLVYVRILTSAGSDNAMFNYSPLASLFAWT